MAKRLAALIFIFVCTTVAWMILGATIMSRTYGMGSDLKEKVASNWGVQQKQSPPTATWTRVRKQLNNFTTNNGGVEKIETREVDVVDTFNLPLDSSRVNVALDLEHRQKGLLWYSTYTVDFAGDHAFRNDTAEERDVSFNFQFPATQAIYDDLVVELDGRPLTTVTDNRGVHGNAKLAAGKPAQLRVKYRSHGLERWAYDFGASNENVAQVRDFKLHMTTNFKAIDFAENTLSPTSKHEDANGWTLDWDYTNLVTGYSIALVMPEKLQPGPLAGQISFFAPVSLFFFFFLMFIITTLRGIDLHPMNYFFLAAAFFAFHLLMAYLVDHISIHLAFAISAVVSIILVVSYLRLVVGIRFAAVEAGLAQFVYLVLFSYAFFFQGFTGLAVTIGSIVTLFVVMQLTGRVDWTAKFAATSAVKPAAKPPAPPTTTPPEPARA
ncbi:MAG: inner membrane CreD family protein [Acidobacteriota bacterium]|nr:inner membrane CreD family protein [Acidobacteriota bacterium]